jgi:flagellum-specific peptidoglycan hydrolase FlgJ
MAGVASARIANRHALHSVYYSVPKKKALLANETRMRTQLDRVRANCATKSDVEHADAQQPPSTRAWIAEIQKNAMKQGFL